MMYRVKLPFEYATGMYMVMPPNLPRNFYPEDKNRMHEEEYYVICFNKNITDEIKNRLIKDYAELYQKEKESGIY